MKYIFLILIAGFLTAYSPAPGMSVDHSSLYLGENEPTKQYIRELRRFVRSVRDTDYQTATYWKEVDKLWNSLMTRKKELDDQFSKRQLERISRLERQYHSVREKKTIRS